MFGHSLVDHRSSNSSNAGDETTIAHWIHLLATESGHQYYAGGKYGFLPQHAMLPPYAQWGYSVVPSVWDSEVETFAEANINTVLITAGNFMQWQSPDMDYPTDPGVSPVSATVDIINWVRNESTAVNFYIYENWPDMAPFLNNGFPPTSSEWDQYNDYTQGDFHEWWIDYHDLLKNEISNASIYMIPVGPIIHRVWNKFLRESLEFLDLYEDDAPHGKSNLYFLAGCVTYMAYFQEKPVQNISLPSLLHPSIHAHYADVVDYIWEELLAFSDENGQNRVFPTDVITNLDEKDKANFPVKIFPNPAQSYIHITSPMEIQKIVIRDSQGKIYYSSGGKQSKWNISTAHWPPNVYFIKYEDQLSQEYYIERIIVTP